MVCRISDPFPTLAQITDDLRDQPGRLAPIFEGITAADVLRAARAANVMVRENRIANTDLALVYLTACKQRG